MKKTNQFDTPGESSAVTIAAPETRYHERAAIDRRVAIAEIGHKLTELESVKVAAMRAMKGASIEIVNATREQGLLIQSACQRNHQLDFSFWSDNLAGLVPATLTFDAAKAAMSVARKMGDECATRIEEAMPHLIPVMAAQSEFELPRREPSRNAGESDPVQKYFQDFNNQLLLRKKVILVTPLESWPLKDLETFLAETDWIEADRKTALALVQPKGGAK